MSHILINLLHGVKMASWPYVDVKLFKVRATKCLYPLVTLFAESHIQILDSTIHQIRLHIVHYVIVSKNYLCCSCISWISDGWTDPTGMDISWNGLISTSGSLVSP